MDKCKEIAKKIREIFENNDYEDIDIVYILGDSSTKSFKIGGNGCALCAKEDLEKGIKKFKLTHNDGSLNVM